MNKKTLSITATAFILSVPTGIKKKTNNLLAGIAIFATLGCAENKQPVEKPAIFVSPDFNSIHLDKPTLN